MKKSALILLMIIVTLSSLFAFSACDKDKGTANGKTVTDLLGREVTVPEKINRVVCIGAGSLRLYTYVGDLSKLVGVEDVDKDGTGVGKTLSIRPYKMVNKDLFNSLPSCGMGGPQGSADAEKILSLNPDIVFSLYTSDKAAMDDFKRIIELVILRVIIPLLPFYIFGIFLSMTQSGQVAGVLDVFVKLIAVIFCMTVVLLLVQFSVAGLAARKNPLKMLRTMLTAYMTALGTQSSAATIPVTLAQTVKLGVRPELASFVVPLCATIHLSGSMMKIVACSLAVMMLSGLDVSMGTYSGFILLLGITMIAAPGVPGGAIMAAIGLLESMLGFDENMIGLMIATYIAMDSFGTATNVTGDGAIAVIVNAIDSRMIRREKR